MDTIVKLKDLRENLPTYESRIARGASFLIVKRSKPVFRITPVNDEGWETVIDFTRFKQKGIQAKDLLERLKRL